MFLLAYWIFSEIDWPLDFNETFVNSSVFNVVLRNDTRIPQKKIPQKRTSF